MEDGKFTYQDAMFVQPPTCMGPCNGLIFCIHGFFSNLSIMTGRTVIPGAAITIREKVTNAMAKTAAVLLFMTGVPRRSESGKLLHA